MAVTKDRALSAHIEQTVMIVEPPADRKRQAQDQFFNGFFQW
jgi:hypothetical protein